MLTCSLPQVRTIRIEEEVEEEITEEVEEEYSTDEEVEVCGCVVT